MMNSNYRCLPEEDSSPLPDDNTTEERNNDDSATPPKGDKSSSFFSDNNNDGEMKHEETEQLFHFRRSSRRRVIAVVLYSITTILLFADQNLLSPNLSAIANEFGFTDLEKDKKLGGDIALAFWMLGAPASIIVGCLTDLMEHRSLLFALTVGIGEGACFVTYFTTTYPQLFVTRAITGLSIGGALPLIYSVLGDLYKAEERHVVSAIVGIGTGVGIALGQGIAGFLGPTFGWRLPFLVVSVPALVCALLVPWMVQDPKRGGMERVVLEQEEQERCHHEREAHHKNDNNQTQNNTCRQTKEEDWKNDDAEQIESSPDMVELSSSLSPVHHQQIVSGGLRGRSNSPRGLLSYRYPPSEETNNHTTLVSENEEDAYVNSSYAQQNWMDDHVKSLVSLLTTPTVLLGMFRGAPGCIPWGIVNTFLNDYLSDDRGMAVEGATLTLLLFGLGNFFGLLVGGAGGNYLYRIDPRYPALLAGCSAIVGCIPFWILLNAIDSSSSFVSIGTVTIIAGMGSGVTGPIIKATLQNATLPTMRGQAFALFNTFDDFGRGLGPVFVAMLVSTMGGRTPAFNVGTVGWVICGILNLAIFFTVKRDEDKVQIILAEKLVKDNQDSSAALVPGGSTLCSVQPLSRGSQETTDSAPLLV